MIITNIPPGLTTTVQLYVRGANNAIGSAVGAPISGSSSGTAYTYNLGANATGDFWCQLSGVSVPDGAHFPVRDDVAYPTLPWSVIDATVRTIPPTPDPITGMCNLLVATTTEGCRVWATLGDANNASDNVLIAQQVVSATTNSSGNATLVLIQYGQFTTGGTYRIRVADSNRVITYNALVRMPNTTSANLEDLTSL